MLFTTMNENGVMGGLSHIVQGVVDLAQWLV
jgi:hypothetical protein